MSGHFNKTEIAERLGTATNAFAAYCTALPDKKFFLQPEGKWSPAQQVKHLITATNTARYALTMPAILVRMVGGKPNRPSRTYEQLVARYQVKLHEGGRASGRYVPKPVRPSFGKEKLLGLFNDALNGFGKSVLNYEQEASLDEYLVPHPLLGKITLRELCYFTIYHTWHHLNSIRKQMGDAPL